MKCYECGECLTYDFVFYKWICEKCSSSIQPRWKPKALQMMTYHLEFTLIGLPATTNSGGRKHWAVKAKEAEIWKIRVMHAVRAQKAKPKEPLKNAQLTLTRFSSSKPDYDGLVSSFKHVIDGLVIAKVIENDTMEVIGVPVFSHEIAPRFQGKIKVEVEG